MANTNNLSFCVCVCEREGGRDIKVKREKGNCKVREMESASGYSNTTPWLSRRANPRDTSLAASHA